MASAEPTSKIKPNLALKEPSLFNVIYMNDDYTSMEFVVNSLIEHFNYNQDTATKITMDVHEQGSAVVAVLPYEIAEQRGIEVTLDARARGFPLQIKVEAEK
jgi:ATP-dependent Clp protease adaptor protein ClpS